MAYNIPDGKRAVRIFGAALVTVKDEFERVVDEATKHMLEVDEESKGEVPEHMTTPEYWENVLYQIRDNFVFTINCITANASGYCGGKGVCQNGDACTSGKGGIAKRKASDVDEVLKEVQDVLRQAGGETGKDTGKP